MLHIIQAKNKVHFNSIKYFLILLFFLRLGLKVQFNRTNVTQTFNLYILGNFVFIFFKQIVDNKVHLLDQ